MPENRSRPLTATLAGRIRDERTELAAQWCERMGTAGQNDPDAVPPDVLLERSTGVIGAIADFIDAGAEDGSSEASVGEAATRLAAARFSQGFDGGEFVADCRVLADLLFAVSRRVAVSPESACDSSAVHACCERICRTVTLVEHAGATQYARLMGERIGGREERLRRFGRLITHELKNRVAATLGAGQLLKEEWLGDAERIRFAGMVEENARAIQGVVETLAALSVIDGERRRQRTVPLSAVVVDVFQHLRELAKARGVELRIGAALPDVAVNASAVDLSLSTYLSNATKFSDASAAERWAEVTAVVEHTRGSDGGAEIVVRVRDNGIGVPADAREHLFERFFRAHAETEGTGLGLSQVQETMQALGGRAWAELDQECGSVFAFALPIRDAAEPSPAQHGVSGSGAPGPDGRLRQDPVRARVFDSLP